MNPQTGLKTHGNMIRCSAPKWQIGTYFQGFLSLVCLWFLKCCKECRKNFHCNQLFCWLNDVLHIVDEGWVNYLVDKPQQALNKNGFKEGCLLPTVQKKMMGNKNHGSQPIFLTISPHSSPPSKPLGANVQGHSKFTQTTGICTIWFFGISFEGKKTQKRHLEDHFWLFLKFFVSPPPTEPGGSGQLFGCGGFLRKKGGLSGTQKSRWMAFIEKELGNSVMNISRIFVNVNVNNLYLLHLRADKHVPAHSYHVHIYLTIFYHMFMNIFALHCPFVQFLRCLVASMLMHKYNYHNALIQDFPFVRLCLAQLKHVIKKFTPALHQVLGLGPARPHVSQWWCNCKKLSGCWIVVGKMRSASYIYIYDPS